MPCRYIVGRLMVKMKKLIFCLVLGFTAGVVFGQANVPAIVVSTFSTRGQAVTADDAESITELFMAELAKQSGVRVVDRTSLDRVVAEMRFQTSDWSNSQKTAQLGAALNAEFLVRGQVNQLGQQISIAITALDIKTLEVVSSSTRNFNSDTIFSNGRDGLFYNLDTMASNIASLIKTKMAELAKQRQEQERSRLIVGKWIARGDDVSFEQVNIYNAENSMEIIFYSDGTLYITLKQCYWENTGYMDIYTSRPGNNFITNHIARGSGSYTITDNKLEISWDANRSGTVYIQKVTTTGSGRNATTSRSWVVSKNLNERTQVSFERTIEFTQNGRNMTWNTTFNDFGNISKVFVKQ